MWFPEVRGGERGTWIKVKTKPQNEFWDSGEHGFFCLSTGRIQEEAERQVRREFICIELL